MISSFTPGARPNGTVLLLSVRYLPGSQPGGDTRGRTKPVSFMYAALKAGGLWYLTGTGQTPQAAGWPAVQAWLRRGNRELESVELLAAGERLWPESESEPEPENCPHHPDAPGAGECWFDSCAACGGYHCAWERCESWPS